MPHLTDEEILLVLRDTKPRNDDEGAIDRWTTIVLAFADALKEQDAEFSTTAFFTDCGKADRPPGHGLALTYPNKRD